MTKIEQKIPEGWSVKKGAEIATLITKGASPKWQGFEYCTNGVLFVTSENVRDGFLDVSNPKFLPIEFSTKQKRSSLHKGDILINIVGASIGRSCIYNQDVQANINQAVCLFRVNSLNYNLYVNLYLSLPQTIQTLLETQTESARPNLSLSDISNLKFLLPPLSEQEKIAGILSCWDDGIEKLSALIEKKKIQKKALMQQLLTGKHRLKGFSTQWDERYLVDLCDFNKGQQLNKADMLVNGRYPVLNGGVSYSGYTNDWNTKNNTITISEGGNSCGFVSFIKEKFWCGGHCYTVFDIKTDIMFLYHLLKYNENNIMNLRVGSGLPNIQISSLYRFKVLVPSDFAEQKAIAEILSKADEEIELLNKKLEAFKQEKKALMQQLLTGKIRVKVN